jgi:hypothetical protein
MPIELFTGQPGNGKTALMMERLLEEAAKGERPIFAAGIDGLQPGLATVLEDPREWKTVPTGSLIFVDEAWKWFGHLHDATRQATPKHVLDLAEHRHHGIDFLWTTQQPNQLYPFVRGLIGNHHHVVRRFGSKMIDVFSWGELNEDIKSQAKRENAQRKTRLLPSQAFGAYKSAEVHTIKPKWPFKVLAIPGLIVAAGLAAWFAFSMLRPDAFAENLTGKKPTDAAQAASAAVPVSSDQSERPTRSFATPTDYARAHLPRFGTMPWTAEIFDERAITADPQLYCMSSPGGPTDDGGWKDASCTCLTEQGTRYQLSQPECRTVARHGQEYNPYKEREEDRREMQPQMALAAPAPPAPPMHAIPGKPAEVNGAGNAL